MEDCKPQPRNDVAQRVTLASFPEISVEAASVASIFSIAAYSSSLFGIGRRLMLGMRKVMGDEVRRV